MKKFPRKILLLSNVPPCDNYSGGQVLVQLARFLPKGSLVCFALMDKFLAPKVPKDLTWIPIEIFEKKKDCYPCFPWSIATDIFSFTSELVKAGEKKKALAALVSFGQKHQVDCIWATLQHKVIQIALPAARKLGVPLYSEIWDDPSWWLDENNFDRLSRRLIMWQFAKTLKYSKKCAVAGPAMAHEYEKLYQAKTVPFLPSLPESWAKPPAKKISKEKELIIGLAGQIYSIEEWGSLMLALDSLGWKIGRRTVKIRLLGSYAGLTAIAALQIEYLGYRSQQETVELMSECDLLYLPYFFSPTYAKIAQLSFPGKLTTYLAAGRPIFFHGPNYSGPGKFIIENKSGIFCDSLETKKIARALKKVVTDQKQYRYLAENGSKTFREFLTFKSLHKSFAQFLEIDEKQLVNYDK